MSLDSWLIYLLLVIAACSSPGPAVLFIMTNTTLHGRYVAVFSALGNISGLLLMGIVAVTGLGALLSASQAAFDLVRYAGAFYLVYLGLRLFSQQGPGMASGLPREGAGKSPGRAFVQAMGVALSNPKAIVFLTALFPQFVEPDSPLLPQFIILMTTLMVFSFLFLMFYALLAHRMKSWLFSPRRLRIFGRVSGGLFIGFGALLATSSHR